MILREVVENMRNMRNPEYYLDPTAHDAIYGTRRDVQDDEDRRVMAFIRSLRTIIEQAGFELLEHVELRDTKTGREYH